MSDHRLDWCPVPGPEALRARARLLADVREFFRRLDVIEVQTPALSRFTVTDRHIQSFSVGTYGSAGEGYLQTSPEYAMKQLLVRGSGSIYQICKCFRDEPKGRLHRPEFTMLEWYRPGFDHHALMEEVEALLQHTLNVGKARKVTFWAAMSRHAEIDEEIPLASLRERLRPFEVSEQTLSALSRDECLDLLMSCCVQPNLGPEPCFIYDYPASLAALAKVRAGAVAERFELFIDGVELANGYHELTDPRAHRERFAADLKSRRESGLPLPELDAAFVGALEQGLPECAGVALGLDRLFMLQQGKVTLHGLV